MKEGTDDMRHRIFSKWISIAAAAVTGCASVCLAAPEALRGTAHTAQIVAEAAAQAKEEPISVLISLDSEALLSDGGLDCHGTDESEIRQARIRSTQMRAEESIRQIYPELVITRRYSTLICGFACELPESLLEAVRALPTVKYAEPTPEISGPYMTKAAETVGIPAFRAESGCTGEGQVIAVIDTELDLSHPMFAALPEGTKTPVTKDDIIRLADAQALAFDIDPEQAYRNSKVPYAVNYSEHAPRYDTALESTYHGTHVCGIAAGRPFTDTDGTVLSGLAPDAQILFLGCGIPNSEGVDTTAALTAIEDAVKLKANVINLSFGNSGYTALNIWTDAINAAEQAGVTVCVSAGNDDNGTYSRNIQHTVERLDNCRLNTLIGDDTRALCVGSVDNPTEVTLKTILFGSQKIGYTGCADSATYEERYLGDTLEENKDYEYVYCGLGASETEDVDLNGKIALVDRGMYTFTEKAEAAYNYGAVGVIIIQNTDGQPKGMINDAPILTAMITKEEGELLKNAAVKTVRFSAETQKMRHELAVSSFSSWGVRESLKVRPDIAGIGGGVRSAAYGSRSAVEDGTSMSSPFVAGCAALLNAVLEKEGCTLTGSERTQRLRQMLMTSAVPVRYDGTLTTPRQQGAGLVSVENMIHDTVLLTADDGECKCSLGDGLSQEFCFDVTLTNLSRQPVQFSEASVELTTDGVRGDKLNGLPLIGGQQSIRCTAETDGLLKPLAAGESRTETVTVRFAQSDFSALNGEFPYGCFIDGFLLLSGADGCCDISMPLVGFAGDWTALPVMNRDSLVSGQQMSITFDSTQPLSEMIARNSEIIEQIGSEIDFSDVYGSVRSVEQHLSEEYRAWMRSGSGKAYISPDSDTLADQLSASFEAYRPWTCSANYLYDAAGKLLQTVQNDFQIDLSTAVFDLSMLEDGDYQYDAELIVPELHERMTPQLCSFPFTVDKTDPDLSTAVREENGRKILAVSASDANLDGILVMATGKGGRADSYDPDHPETSVQYGLKQRTAVMSAFSLKEIGYVNFGAPTDNSDSPIPLRILRGEFPNDLIEDEMGWFDYLTPEAGESLIWAEFDITDFTDYWFVAVDRAYNYTAYSQEQTAFYGINPGRYLGSYGIYDFTDTAVTFRSFRDNYPISYDYELARGVMTMHDGPSNYYFHVRNWNEDGLRLSGQFDWAFHLGTNADLDLLRELEPYEYGDYTMNFGATALEKPKLAMIIYRLLEEQYGELVSFDTGFIFEPDAVASYCIYRYDDTDTDDGEPELLFSIRIDLMSGIAVLPDGTEEQLFRPFHGDYDGDGIFSVADAVLLARYNAEEAGIELTRPYDLDGNGKLDAGDLNMLLEYLATEDWEGIWDYGDE